MKTPILLLLGAVFLGTATALPVIWVKQSGERMVAAAAAATSSSVYSTFCEPPAPNASSPDNSNLID